MVGKWALGGSGEMASVKGPSKTAVLAAVGRALHRDDPQPRVLDDHLALGLAGEEALAVLERLHRDMPSDVLLAFTRWTSVRTRFAEDVVEKSLEDGVRQLVILGAGLDSFAYRRPDLLEDLRVVEVDHPSSQAWKRERLASLGIEEPRNLVFAPIDFEKESLREGLDAAGFAWDRPTMRSTKMAPGARTIAATRGMERPRCRPPSRLPPAPG